MSLVLEKTRLLVLLPKSCNWVPSKPVLLNEHPIFPSVSAEHLGLLRSSSLSNVETLQDRIMKHKKSLFSVLNFGAAKGHQGNPAASLKVMELYSSPVLYNGVGSLVLNRSEMSILNNHQKRVIESLIRLHPKSPIEIVTFLSGIPPPEAIVAMKMLSLFGMIARLGP